MPTELDCRREVVSLHEFFVDWYAGERPAAAFDRLADALAPGFEMVTPDGAVRDRAAVLDGIREARGRDAPGEFDIDIRNLALRRDIGDHALVRYEEWQHRGEATTGRLGTVLLATDDDAPAGLAWLDLQETWLDPPDGD